MQAYIFDVDGVLVDSPHERAWRESLQQLMAGPWRDLAAQTSYAPARFTTAVYQEFVAGKPREAGARAALEYFDVPDLDGARLQQYCDAKQVRLLELVERGEFTVFPDALRLVQRLLKAGVPLAAASSSRNANMFLERVPFPVADADPVGGRRSAVGGQTNATLLDVFAANVCGMPFARGKPDPEIFLSAANALGADPAVCTVVEDAPSGILAAKSGGMRAVGIARLDDAALLAAAGADIVVTSLDDVAG